ncbi:MAG: NADH-quinone oxidoreductase subunit L [Candidatus Omnitrophica bacterium]|nr:NADH-quinone oxidoreductase subunit L [Candidatus Omnitrophota bacterium]
MYNLTLLFIISITPLLAFAKIWLLPKSQRHFAPLIGVAGTFIPWIASILLGMDFVGATGRSPLHYDMSWLPQEQVRLSVGFFVDHLNLVTLVIVTTISFFVQVFSVAYMYDDESRPRYFSFLSFFVFAMINLVVASNLLQTYLFWELVGLASYLLIGFWFENEAPAKAARKAFVTTRFGDLGFYLGIILLLILFGSTSFADLNNTNALTHQLQPWILTTIALLIFCGIAGKSAQAPLHAWLPDAMEGPTPVSALIHSATMVAAGVFLLARLYPFFNLSPTAMQVILAIAAVTALATATVATVQNDIKRILAYSTISQLGLMVMGLAAGTYTGGLFHLATHATFKSLLFLTAGALIHHYHTNDIWEMARAGARRQWVPMFALVVGGLSLAGVVPFSGFWSKDLILEQLLHLHPFWYLIGLSVSFFTSYYTFRLLAVFFFSRQEHPVPVGANDHSPLLDICLALPLVVLAIGSFFVGLSGTPWGEFRLLSLIDPQTHPEPLDPKGMLWSTMVAAAGLVWAFKNYRVPEKREPAKITPDPVRSVLEKKYFIDHLYENVIGRITMGIAAFCHQFDRTVINGIMVNGTARKTYDAGSFISRLQSGFFQDYLFWGILVGMAGLFWVLK